MGFENSRHSWIRGIRGFEVFGVSENSRFSCIRVFEAYRSAIAVAVFIGVGCVLVIGCFREFLCFQARHECTSIRLER